MTLKLRKIFLASLAVASVTCCAAALAACGEKEVVIDDPEDVAIEEPEQFVSFESITLDRTDLELVEGETYQLSATVLPENVEYTVSWSSDNTSVATVSSDGLVTAQAGGSAGITAEVTSNGGGGSAICRVYVKTYLEIYREELLTAYEAFGDTDNVSYTLSADGYTLSASLLLNGENGINYVLQQGDDGSFWLGTYDDDADYFYDCFYDDNGDYYYKYAEAVRDDDVKEDYLRSTFGGNLSGLPSLIGSSDTIARTTEGAVINYAGSGTYVVNYEEQSASMPYTFTATVEDGKILKFVFSYTMDNETYSTEYTFTYGTNDGYPSFYAQAIDVTDYSVINLVYCESGSISVPYSFFINVDDEDDIAEALLQQVQRCNFDVYLDGNEEPELLSGADITADMLDLSAIEDGTVGTYYVKLTYQGVWSYLPVRLVKNNSIRDITTEGYVEKGSDSLYAIFYYYGDPSAEVDLTAEENAAYISAIYKLKNSDAQYGALVTLEQMLAQDGIYRIYFADGISAFVYVYDPDNLQIIESFVDYGNSRAWLYDEESGTYSTGDISIVQMYNDGSEQEVEAVIDYDSFVFVGAGWYEVTVYAAADIEKTRYTANVFICTESDLENYEINNI